MPKKERIITPFGAALGRRLRQAREAVEPPLTQVDIARLLDRSKGAVCKWESGENEPNSSCIIALSKLYGVTVDWLIGLEAGPAHKRANPPVAVTGTVPVVSSSHAARWSFEAPIEVLVTAKQYPPGAAAAILVDSAAMANTCPSGSHAVLCRVEQPQAGDVVFAVLGDQTEPVLRNLVRDGSSLLLVADDARYPTYPLNDSVRVVARVSEVIQRRLV